MSYQPQTFINYDNIRPLENLKNGLCTISGFIQGFHKASGNRLTEVGVRERISDAMKFMVTNAQEVVHTY